MGAPARGGVQHARQVRLADAGLAAHQSAGGAAPGQPLDRLFHADRPGRAAHEGLGGRGGEGGGGVRDRRAAQTHEDFGVDRLGQIVERPTPHGRHDAARVRVARDHDGAELGAARAEVGEERDAVGVREHEIEHREVWSLVSNASARLRGAPHGIGFEAGVLEQLGERAPDARIILDEKRPWLGHRDHASLVERLRVASARSSSWGRNGLLRNGRSVAPTMAAVSGLA